jgi:uncharacterized protein (TIGR02453 family)
MIFSKALFEFLEDLADNNDREWFTENKSRYVEDVQTPSLRLIEEIAKPLRKISPFLVANPARSGGSLTRIYRDTRFSKDKTPYKTYVGMHFRHEAGKDIHAPGIYVHFATDECLIGAGCYRPEPSALARIRAAIDADGSAWKKARDDKKFSSVFTLWGESLKSTPRDYPRDHPLIEDLKRKDFLGVAPLTREQVLSDSLITIITDRVKASRPMMRFLCESLGVPY